MSSSTRRFKIALVGIYHESNTFINRPTTFADFAASRLFLGERITAEYKEAFHEIGGMIEFCSSHDIDLLPVFYAETTPGGKIEGSGYEQLRGMLLHELTNKLPVDACLVVPHGAAVAEGYDDVDGDWLSHVKRLVGDVPVVGTLDPHANVSARMISNTDTLVAYATNPHIDQRETGKKAAALLYDILRTGQRPAHVFRHCGAAISIERQLTAAFPCRELYEAAQQAMSGTTVHHVSIILGFPYADVEDMGTAIIVSAVNRAEAEKTVQLLAEQAHRMRNYFVAEKMDVARAIDRVEKKNSPTLLLDMGDNVGAGSPGDSTLILQHIEQESELRCFICINDPRAVTRLQNETPGVVVTLAIGGTHVEYNLVPFVAPVKLVTICDGKFSEKEPRHGGQTHYDMGTTAIVETLKGNVIMITSRRTPPFSLRQLTAAGIVPGHFDVIVAKGVNAPIAAYNGICSTHIQVDTPGYTQADMTRFAYHNRRKPLFPFENE